MMAGVCKQNDSENIKVIIGKLIEKADTTIRPVISVFDCFQTRQANFQKLNKFNVPVLESCAEFLGISQYLSLIRITSRSLLSLPSLTASTSGLWLSCPLSVESAVKSTPSTTNLNIPRFSVVLGALRDLTTASETESFTRLYLR